MEKWRPISTPDIQQQVPLASSILKDMKALQGFGLATYMENLLQEQRAHGYGSSRQILECCRRVYRPFATQSGIHFVDHYDFKGARPDRFHWVFWEDAPVSTSGSIGRRS